MNKKCKKCGSLYETKDQKVTLYLNHQDIESIEDVIFTDFLDRDESITKADWKRVDKFWKQLCKEEDKWKS
jgi:hypothetical protein